MVFFTQLPKSNLYSRQERTCLLMDIQWNVATLLSSLPLSINTGY
jgi:hypothetical protein